jgi:hypothetical protein
MPSFKTKYRPRKWMSISDMVTYSRCPRKFFYSTGCGACTGESIAMKYGEAIHAGLPLAVTNPDSGLAAFLKVWGERDGLQDPNRNSFQAGDIFTAYHNQQRQYKLIQYGRTSMEDVNSFEIPFVLSLGGSVPMVGRMDGLCEMNGKKFVIEYKTSSELSARTTTAWQLSPQLIGYSMAASILLGEQVGVILEVIRTTKNVAFETSMKNFSDENINFFVNWANKIIQDMSVAEYTMFNSSIPFDGFPKNFCGCHPYAHFGVHGYMCEYAPLCEMEDSIAWDLVEYFSFNPERPYEDIVNPKIKVDDKLLILGEPNGL